MCCLFRFGYFAALYMFPKVTRGKKKKIVLFSLLLDDLIASLCSLASFTASVAATKFLDVVGFIGYQSYIHFDVLH